MSRYVAEQHKKAVKKEKVAKMKLAQKRARDAEQRLRKANNKK